MSSNAYSESLLTQSGVSVAGRNFYPTWNGFALLT
jgi:hypothetical protein